MQGLQNKKDLDDKIKKLNDLDLDNKKLLDDNKIIVEKNILLNDEISKINKECLNLKETNTILSTKNEEYENRPVKIICEKKHCSIECVQLKMNFNSIMKTMNDKIGILKKENEKDQEKK